MRPATDGADTDPREYKTSIPAVCQGRFVQIRLPIADFRDWWHATRDRDVVRTVWLFWIALSGGSKEKAQAGGRPHGAARSYLWRLQICVAALLHLPLFHRPSRFYTGKAEVVARRTRTSPR
jgi:hypothetical protein